MWNKFFHKKYNTYLFNFIKKIILEPRNVSLMPRNKLALNKLITTITLSRVSVDILLSAHKINSDASNSNATCKMSNTEGNGKVTWSRGNITNSTKLFIV